MGVPQNNPDSSDNNNYGQLVETAPKDPAVTTQADPQAQPSQGGGDTDVVAEKRETVVMDIFFASYMK